MIPDRFKWAIMIAGILKFILGLLFLVFLYNCTGDFNEFTGPAYQFDTAVNITELSASVDPLAINGDTSLVSAVILNSSDQPITGISATFTASDGTIVYGADAVNSISDSTGTVSAWYISGSAIGNQQVYLQTGMARDTLTIELISDVSALTLTVTNTEVYADGVSSVQITANALNNSGEPVGNTNLRFATDRGVFSSGEQVVELLTDDAGQAITEWVSEASFQDEIANLFVTDLDVPELGESVTLNLIGISFQIETQVDSLIADGMTNTQLTARVKETATGNPLSGVIVTWSTNLGVITSPTVTDGLGAAPTTLVSPVAAGTALIEAFFGNTLTDQLEVEFINE